MISIKAITVLAIVVTAATASQQQHSDQWWPPAGQSQQIPPVPPPIPVSPSYPSASGPEPMRTAQAPAYGTTAQSQTPDSNWYNPYYSHQPHHHGYMHASQQGPAPSKKSQRAPTIPRGMIFASDSRCSQAWTDVENQLEAAMAEYDDDSRYGKALKTFQRLLDDMGGASFIDASLHALKGKGMARVGAHMQRMRKRIHQLANRPSIATRHPQYKHALDEFEAKLQQQEHRWSEPIFYYCEWPAMLVNFSVGLIGMEEEIAAEYEDDDEDDHGKRKSKDAPARKPLLNFAEAFAQMAKPLHQAASQDWKKNKNKDDLDVVIFEQEHVKMLEKLSTELKQCAAGKKGRQSSDSSSSSSTYIIIGIIVLVIIIVAIAIFAIMRRKSNSSN